MINFRFHLASLIAIFLALALGVVVGAGVIDRGVVDTLNGRLDSVESKSDRIQGENDVLRGENSELTDAIGAMQCPAVDNTLLAEDIGIVAVRGVDDAAVKNTIAAATCGGGTVTGTLWLEDKWALANDDDVAAMAQAVGSSSKRKETVRTAAWKQLVERLQSPPPAGDISTDFLTTLEDAQFVTFEPQGEDGPPIAEFPRRNASMLLAVGNDAVVPSKDVVMPAATAFVAAGVPLVVAEVVRGGRRRTAARLRRSCPSATACSASRCRRSTISIAPRDRPPRCSPSRACASRNRRSATTASTKTASRCYPTSRSEAGRLRRCRGPRGRAHRRGTGTRRDRRWRRGAGRACPGRSRSRTSSGPTCKASTCPTSTACSRHRRSAVSSPMASTAPARSGATT